MPEFHLAIPIYETIFPCFIVTDETGSLLELHDRLDDLPVAAKKLIFSQLDEEIYPIWQCYKILLEVAIPFAAHGYLDYEPLATLTGTATNWPEDLGGIGERPSQAECLGYRHIVESILEDPLGLGVSKNFPCNATVATYGIVPLLIRYFHAVASNNFIVGSYDAAVALAHYPSPTHETLFLDHFEKSLNQTHVRYPQLLKFCVTDRARELAIQAFDITIKLTEPRLFEVRNSLLGLIGFKGIQVEAAARQFFKPTSEYLNIATDILLTATNDRSGIEQELFAMLNTPEARKKEVKDNVEYVLRRLDSTLLVDDDNEFFATFFPANPYTGELETTHPKQSFNRTFTKKALTFFIQLMKCPTQKLADSAFSITCGFYTVSKSQYWVDSDGSIEVISRSSKSEPPITPELLTMLYTKSVQELNDPRAANYLATRTLANLGTWEPYRSTIVDYFLDRITHPHNELDPLVLPRYILHLVQSSERREEIKEAARVSMRLLPHGKEAESLMRNAVNSFDDELYLELYHIGRKRGVLSANYSSLQIVLRRLSLQKHPYRKLLYERPV